MHEPARLRLMTTYILILDIRLETTVDAIRCGFTLGSGKSDMEPKYGDSVGEELNIAMILAIPSLHGTLGN